MKVYTFYFFAVRESVLESLGFNPFELVFGQIVRFFFVVLLFYVHGKHLRSCRDGQLT